MFGLIVSAPAMDEACRSVLRARLHDFDLPLSAFTDAPACMFREDMSRAEFLRTASAALLLPGTPLPAGALLHWLDSDPLTANVLRKYLFLQLSLLPYLRPGRAITPLPGGFLVGDALLIVPVSAEDTVDIELPPGVWTELSGLCHERRLRCMRGYNEMPVLVRENTLLPIGVNDRSTSHDDADRLTLHWFQPDGQAVCTLADGTRYTAYSSGGRSSVTTYTGKPFHVLIHKNGETQMLQ